MRQIAENPEFGCDVVVETAKVRDTTLAHIPPFI